MSMLPSCRLARAATILLGFLSCLLLSLPELAAQEAPLRLVFVNSDPSDGSVVYDEVKAVLQMSKDLDLKDPGLFLSAGVAHSVRLETLRDGARRAQSGEALKAMLVASDAEGAVILDVFGGGRTMQLVVIGPQGEQLGDIRQSISPLPTQDESVTALKKVFKVLVPEIRAARERAPAPRAEVGLIGQDEPPVDTDSIKARVIAEHRQQHGNLTLGATPRVGGFFGTRSLALQAEGSDYELTHASPFVGVGVDVDTILALLDAETTAIGAGLFFAWAPFTTMLADADGHAHEKSSSFLNLRLDLHYIKGMAERLLLRATLGAELLRISVDDEDNEIYLGNDYYNLRAGAGLTYTFGEFARLHLDAAVLPVLSAHVSEQTMGSADLSWGFDAGARLEIIAYGPYVASLGYQFKHYGVTYSTPKLAELQGMTASASDSFHLGQVVFGYQF